MEGEFTFWYENCFVKKHKNPGSIKILTVLL